eukprot:COSAG03_NODE_18380_length_356_cov_0.863813_1_plen_20_part_01
MDGKRTRMEYVSVCLSVCLS